MQRRSSPARVRIATRASPLALWQAERVRTLIGRTSPVPVDLVPLTTDGDRQTTAPLADGGGKGLFVKALEAALTEGRADVAVHSMKDVPTVPPEGFTITTIGPRADPRDGLVAGALSRGARGASPSQEEAARGASPSRERARTFDTLPEGARVGSSSPRRRAQLLFARPDLVVVPMRGNVGTRLGKLDAGAADALVLACAGLDRLELGDRVSQRLAVDLCLPAPGQGALAVEYAAEREDLADLLAPAVDVPTERAVAAERALTRSLGADCTTPLGAYASLDGDTITLRSTLLDADGQHAWSVADTGTEPIALGQRLADALLRLGDAPRPG